MNGLLTRAILTLGASLIVAVGAAQVREDAGRLAFDVEHRARDDRTACERDLQVRDGLPAIHQHVGAGPARRPGSASL